MLAASPVYTHTTISSDEIGRRTNKLTSLLEPKMSGAKKLAEAKCANKRGGGKWHYSDTQTHTRNTIMRIIFSNNSFLCL
jgi:hypothetical protein